MKPRNFPDFIKAYLAYAHDDFTPKQFNLWSGLSTVAGALERKVWLPWSDTFSYYPNIFVLMVSLPGAGKSTALNKAIDLLQEMNEVSGRTMNILPSQVTEAKFIELMGLSSPFEVGNVIKFQSCGYYFASEASNSLKNLFGDFIACLTEFYDCPKRFAKATMKGGDPLVLNNVCLNLLAGSTFDYLSKLVTDENVMGGFASRLLYIVHREKLVRTQKFQLGGEPLNLERNEIRRMLIEDLAQIHKMVGPFTASPEFARAWETWYPAFEEKRQSNPSEKMQSLLVRTNTNMLKVAMLFSASRSSERILRAEDWDRAQMVIEPIEEEIPTIFRESKALDTRSQEGLNQAILKAMHGGVRRHSELKLKLIMAGFNPMSVENTLRAMKENGAFTQGKASATGMDMELLINPNHHL